MTDIAPETVTGRPLITMAIRHFNNAPFVAEALASAFAQTYSPLEIVFIDDASTDGGDRIAQKTISEYYGPHKVRMHCNARNEGLGAQNAQILALSAAQIIVYADADDISVPERCTKIAKAFAENGPDTLGIVSDFDLIDPFGRQLLVLDAGRRVRAETWTAEMAAQEIAGPVGAVAAFRRRVLETGGAIDHLRKGDDLICGFRALVLGRMATIPEVLVYRRVHSSNDSGPIHPSWTGRELCEWVAKQNRVRVLVPAIMRRDVDLFERHGLIDAERAAQLRRVITKFSRKVKLHRALPRLPFYRALLSYFELRRLGLTLRLSLRSIMQARMPGLAMVFLRRNALIRTRESQSS